MLITVLEVFGVELDPGTAWIVWMEVTGATPIRNSQQVGAPPNLSKCQSDRPKDGLIHQLRSMAPCLLSPTIPCNGSRRQQSLKIITMESAAPWLLCNAWNQFNRNPGIYLIDSSDGKHQMAPFFRPAVATKVKQKVADALVNESSLHLSSFSC